MSVKLDRGGNVPNCSNCMVSLIGRQYLIQKSQKFCVDCYDSLYCNKCNTCNKIIATGTKDISYKNLHFHDGCFTCSGCEKSLTGQKFIVKDSKFICAQCFENKFTPKCTACQTTFKPGTKRMEYKGKSYHEKCFCCISCKTVIGKKSFVEKDGGFFCEDCFKNKLANKCAKCKKIIKLDGVSYRDETYHSSCLRCAGCKAELGGKQLVSHDDEPYCVDCHTKNFAKKCLRCNKAISGLGETQMIAFEDFHWHIGCFRCAKCNTALEGEGFILEEEETYCQDCAEDECP